ncbi:Glucose-repressible alcohol dehydrogenase transcriptional effector, partial [Dispira parvispora]
MYYGPNTGVPSPLNGPIAPGSPARVSSPGNSMASLPPMGYSVAHNASPLYSNTISRYPVQMNLSQKLQQPSQMVNMQQPMGMGPGSTSYNGLSATLLGMSNSGANNPGLNNAVGNGGPLMNGMGQVYNTNLSPTMHPLGTGPTALPPVASVPLSTSHQHLIAMHQKSRQTMTPHFHASTAFSASRSSMYSQPESTSTTCASATVGEGRTSTDDASPMISSTKAGSSAVTASGTTSASDSTGTVTVESTWTGIDLGGMGLHSVSTTLFRYSFLTKVYLNHNRLTYLPSSVRDLVNLEELDVSGNQLSTLPPELGMVTTLKKLLAFDNLIQSIPYELGTLFRLNVLGLEGNPLQDPLKTLLQKEGTQELIHYLRDNASPVAPPEPRPWVTLDKEAAQKGHEIVTVMSYNILSSRYATPQQYGYVPSWALDWDHRRDIILKEILERDADIVCLQELETSEFYDV